MKLSKQATKELKVMEILESLELELGHVQDMIDEIYLGERSGLEMDALEARCMFLEADIKTANRAQIKSEYLHKSI